MSTSFYVGMPVSHKDGGSTMTVKQLMPSGDLLCAWIGSDGEDIERVFRHSDLEPSAAKIGDKLMMIGT
ncbi:hypothetical protein [Citrobacter sp. RHBSTW-00325]|uniref:hypothetical protein n=1 Tax=Citrobacter sp. RHBSTW-00325 TaxID=2742644 RepID=UPI0015FB7DD0|nr:hypothetical protein [Citrobacter sp. RHBSTW-00325]MBA7759954.1 hypothetical protein [Citrobacter sp. RHBSTW-00325]